MNGITAMVQQMKGAYEHHTASNPAEELKALSTSERLEAAKDGLINDYRRNVPICELRRKYGISESTISKFLKNSGVFKAKRREFSKEFKQGIARERLQGARTIDLAAKYDVGPSVISKWVGQYEKGELS